MVPKLTSCPHSKECISNKKKISCYNYKKKKKVVDLERGPFSLVSTTEELLDRKVAAPV
jgi:hypothetical protein